MDGSVVNWVVRLDFDQVKGPHVNAKFGTSSFAFQYDESLWVNENPKKTMRKITRDLNERMGYSGDLNEGKTDPDFDSAGGQEKLVENLKAYFTEIVTGPC